MSKISLDKYYTPQDLAKSCIERVYDIIGKDNIKQVIEPSAGNGSFSATAQFGLLKLYFLLQLVKYNLEHCALLAL